MSTGFTQRVQDHGAQCRLCAEYLEAHYGGHVHSLQTERVSALAITFLLPSCSAYCTLIDGNKNCSSSFLIDAVVTVRLLIIDLKNGLLFTT